MLARLATLLTIILCSGCVSTNVSTASGFTGLSADSSLLLMTPDIKYYRVTASGLTEPIAEWTESARNEFEGAINAFSSDNNLNLARTNDTDLTNDALEYHKLHAAVGQTILVNHYGATPLPAKNKAFDWSLGDGVTTFSTQDNHRYALFVHYRDYQAGGGRVGMAIFAAALGVGIYTGHQGGFASLVDLENGDVVWFNNVPLAQGDMRSASGAQRLVKQLLAELPDTLK